MKVVSTESNYSNFIIKLDHFEMKIWKINVDETENFTRFWQAYTLGVKVNAAIN